MARILVQLDWKHAALSTTFGREWATKLFGEEAIESLPVLKTGKNRGLLKGFVHWRKSATAGFIPGYGPAKVGQLVDAWISDSPLGTRITAINGQWMGRKQPLAGSSGTLFEKARIQHVRDEKRRLALDAEEAGDSHFRAGTAAKAAACYAKAAALYEEADVLVTARLLRAEAERLLQTDATA